MATNDTELRLARIIERISQKELELIQLWDAKRSLEAQRLNDSHEPESRDAGAMNAIHALLSGKEWDTSTIEEIAYIVARTGRAVGEPHEEGRHHFELGAGHLLSVVVTDEGVIMDAFTWDEHEGTIGMTASEWYDKIIQEDTR